MVTRNEKDVYNLHLSISRSSRNKPFKIRENFEGLEETPDYLFLKKLTKFFFDFPHIDPNIFFKAPYSIYPDEEWFDLKFFASLKAVNAYSIYFKSLQEKSPDSQENIEFIKNSLRFIGSFCIRNNILLSDYMKYSKGITSIWMKHIKEHKISVYVLLEFPEFYSTIQTTPSDEVYMFLGYIYDNLQTYINRYNTSVIARKFVKEGMKKISDFIEKNIKNKVV